MIRSLRTAILVMGMCSTVVLAKQNTSESATSLHNVKAVYVQVNYNAPPEQQYGLTEDELFKQVKLTLHADNIRTLDREEWIEAAGSPYLRVNIEGAALDPKRVDTDFMYNYTVELVQRVRLEREPRQQCEAITWSEGSFAIVPHDRLDRIKDSLEDLLLKFNHALQSSNQRS